MTYPITFYVGATFTRYEEARAVVDALCDAGHECAFDWTRTDAFGADGHPLPDVDPYRLPPEVQARHARNDLAAVRRADLCLFLAQQASCGWPVECGAALAYEVPHVWLVAPFKPTVFWALPGVETFDSLAPALRRLRVPAELADRLAEWGDVAAPVDASPEVYGPGNYRRLSGEIVHDGDVIVPEEAGGRARLDVGRRS